MKKKEKNQNRKTVIIFGGGGTGRRVRRLLETSYDVIAFVDNDSSKWGTIIDEIECIKPDELKNRDFDFIALGTLMGYEELQEQIKLIGIPDSRVLKQYVEMSVLSRICFLKRYAEDVYRKGLKGSVGEAGVFRGEFAKDINKYFPDRKCYLFDTFDGFDERDIALENKESLVQADYMHNLSEKIVFDKMPHKENVVIKKGWFPETTYGIEDEFVFVNLDMDLYKPILEGLKFFYPRMVKGGVILIHDYFSDVYPNLKQSLDDYENETGIVLATAPAGDDISIAVIKV